MYMELNIQSDKILGSGEQYSIPHQNKYYVISSCEVRDIIRKKNNKKQKKQTENKKKAKKHLADYPVFTHTHARRHAHAHTHTILKK